LSRRPSRKFRVDGCRFFPDQPCERGSFRAVSLAGGAEAAEQVHLKLRRLGEFVGRQLGGSLVEIVGDAHRADRVRARRARAHLVELVHGRQHRPFPLLHDVVKGWVLAEWKISANNRRARFYTLTTAGKKQLGVEESRFSQMFGAIMRVMKTT
jgi:hypothetical protein